VDYLESIITAYNQTPHEALDDLTPQEASEEQYKAFIQDLNKKEKCHFEITISKKGQQSERSSPNQHLPRRGQDAHELTTRGQEHRSLLANKNDQSPRCNQGEGGSGVTKNSRNRGWRRTVEELLVANEVSEGLSEVLTIGVQGQEVWSLEQLAKAPCNFVEVVTVDPGDSPEGGIVDGDGVLVKGILSVEQAILGDQDVMKTPVHNNAPVEGKRFSVDPLAKAEHQNCVGLGKPVLELISNETGVWRRSPSNGLKDLLRIGSSVSHFSLRKRT